MNGSRWARFSGTRPLPLPQIWRAPTLPMGPSQANLALMQGLASGLQIKGVEALLEREPGRCCVVFERVPRTEAAKDPSV